MNIALRLFFSAVVTAISIIIALIPEIVMVAIWTMISPTTELGQVVLVVGLLVAGGGFCILFAIIGLSAWISGIKSVLS